MGLDGNEDGHWISFDGELILFACAIWPRVEGCAVPAFAAIVGDTSQLFESVLAAVHSPAQIVSRETWPASSP